MPGWILSIFLPTGIPERSKKGDIKMNKLRSVVPLVPVLLLTLQIGIACGQAEPTNLGSELGQPAWLLSSNDSVVGSWYLLVTSQTFPTPFRAEITFTEGGGLIASAQGDILLNAPPGVPPAATAGHGAWSRTANREYLFTFRQIFYSSDGSYAGGAKIRNSSQINKDGDEMTGQLVVDYYNENDEVVFTGSGSFTATRIVVEPLTP
jgi:hypothetical protein